MKSLIHEIHHRSLWQVLGIYLGASWLVLQIVDTMAGALSLPDWAASLALFLLVVGLPVVLATAFVQEGISTRPARSGESSAAEASRPGARAAAEAEAIDEAPVPGEARPRLLTWKRAITGGVAAFALLGLLSAGWLISRALGVGPGATLVAQGLIEERAPILVADFEGADEELAKTATDALRIDLSQSRVVAVVQPTEVGQVLRRMAREPDAPMTLDLAREVAQREGIPVVVAGDLDRAGDAYVVSARLIRAESGEVLVSDRERAGDATAVLDAIDDLSQGLRERIGESIGLMRREEPLQRVTTSSLGALRRYSQALRAFELEGDEDRAISLLEEAVLEDTAFAMAWRKLGTLLANQFVERERSVDALERAFRHRDRLTDRERYQVEGIYNYNVAVDVPSAITAYENLLDIDPADDYALNNLGVMYGYLRENERSGEYYERAIAVDSSSSVAFGNAVTMRLAQRRYDAAREMVALMGERFPENPARLQFSASLASATGAWEDAEGYTRQLMSEQTGSPFWTAEATRHLASLAAIRGRLDEARAWLDNLMSTAAAAGQAVAYLNEAASLALLEVGALGDRARAKEVLDAALERFPLAPIPAMDRPYPLLANTYAWAGDYETSKSLLSEYESEVRPELRSWIARLQTTATLAELASAEGRHEEALELAGETAIGFCRTCDAQLIARLHDVAGARDSAIAAYEHYEAVDWQFRAVLWDQYVKGPFLERLGQLYDARGDLRDAARSYAEFVELWADADAELQPRVQAAQARLSEILSEIG